MTTINMTPDTIPAQTVSEEAQIQQEWLADCRNPETKQTTGTLLNTQTGGMCCLGVLGNGLNARHPEWLKANRFQVEILGNGMLITDHEARVQDYSVIPGRLASLLGIPMNGTPSLTAGEIRTTFGELRELGIQVYGGNDVLDEDEAITSLAGLNDGGNSLPVMANVIEKVLEPR